jgi:CheY-like chemotaxis protein
MQSATTSFSSNQALDADGKELRILLVEDFAPLRARLAEMLNESGVMRVTATADTESEALALIATQDFDGLVIDVELREGSGVVVVRSARARWTTLPLPVVIVLTNHVKPAVEARCMAAGADYFLDKMRQFDQVSMLLQRRRN